jgi:hypothetical protein
MFGRVEVSDAGLHLITIAPTADSFQVRVVEDGGISVDLADNRLDGWLVGCEFLLSLDPSQRDAGPGGSMMEVDGVRAASSCMVVVGGVVVGKAMANPLGLPGIWSLESSLILEAAVARRLVAQASGAGDDC